MEVRERGGRGRTVRIREQNFKIKNLRSSIVSKDDKA